MWKRWVILIVLATLWSCASDSNYERPRDPWVFRSVLDERPRMLTMALNDELWAAYDVQNCGLYKAWNGGVNFDGAVYTTKHGPQPNSLGYEYLTNNQIQPQWSLVSNGQTTPLVVDYQGHIFSNGQVALNYQLQHDQQVISISETPEFVTQDGEPGLKRSFQVSGLTGDQKVQVSINLGGLSSKYAFDTNGEFKETTSEEKTYGGATTYEVKGQLQFGNGATDITSYFKRLQRAPEKQDVEAVDEDIIAQGATLIENSDCKTCHNPTERTVGPSYTEIAERYPNTNGSIRELSAKIVSGGTGNWGEVPMTAHPDLEESDANTMVRYILSLDTKEGNEESGADLFLGQPSVAMSLDDENQEAANGRQSGLATSVYVYDDHSVSWEDILNTQPILNGVAPAVHVVERPDLGTFNSNVLFEFEGQINVDEDTNVDFRLISDDGSYLYINDKLVIDNGGFHGPEAVDGEVILKAGANDLKIVFYQGGGGASLSFQWAPHGSNSYEVVPESVLSHDASQIKEVVPYVPRDRLVRSIPGDRRKLNAVHPSFDLAQARPDSFQGRIGGMDFLSDGRLVVCTWDSLGPVYILDGVQANDPEAIKVTRIATGLAEPLGLKIVDDEIYVLQKQELTHLIDHDGDEVIDEYKTVCNDWQVSANFHEFAFGLEYQDGYFYAALATAINPGGASTQPQIPDRGKAIKISREDGSLEFIATGLRTPNGIGEGYEGELFIADNQGDWLPSSKIVHVQPGSWYGSRSVDFTGTADLTETQPVVWLPQDEIGNSPSQPLALNIGPYQNQMIHGEVTHGGIKRVYVEEVNGAYQGALFRFTQGMEAGVNRICWGPDGALYVGGVGSSGNWGDGQKWYGLQRLSYNENVTFEMLKVMARTDGLEIEFTEPLELGSGTSADEYQIQQWYYLPTEQYGGPKLDLETLEIASVNLSDDRKKVFLELPGIKAGHVVYVRIIRPFRSENQNSLWTTEAWYTLNQIPSDLPGFKSPSTTAVANTLSDAEKAAGWELLFDGKTTSGWRNYKNNSIGSAWKVRDGSLMLDNSNKQDGRIIGGGDIISDREFENFELSLEWKIQKNGNSGIIFNVVESDEYDFVWQTGPEMQVLDNVGHPDGRIETHRAGDLYDMIACSFVASNGPDEWNKVRLVSKDGKVSHWMNGYKVVEYEMHSQQWLDMIAQSKFKDMPGFGRAKGGHISLQDHSDRVWYRNIKIREL